MHVGYRTIGLLVFLSLAIVPFAVQAATITQCTLDEDTYYQGDTGYMTVTIYNDKDYKIQVTELTATINYYYTDETTYVQKFYTDADLPAEIQPGNSSSFEIPFSLPTNIAAGYTKFDVKAKTEVWNPQTERWFLSDHPSYQPLLYIESPYKDRFEDQLTINDQLEEQLDEQQTINKNTTNMMYLFGATTIAFAAVAGFLYFIFNRRPRYVSPVA